MGLTRVVVGLLRSLCSLALGAAIAIVASDLLIQFGLLGVIIIKQTLQ